ncbi:MAG TPA: DNA-directed RNA polymerase subunit D [Candidatus Nanoarchaeia archaeon]|nr:DNA-directed RNA polymerase subunit D [Candidatus Nanoarchaeia archaeon]
MDAKVFKSEKDKAVLLLHGITPAVANMIRRYTMMEVPTLAVEDVEFRKNSSILFDEMIAHRLGLVVLKSDLKTYNKREECKCGGKGCARCEVKMALSGKGPSVVMASEMKFKDPKIRPVFPNTPIVKLLKGQEIEVEGTATLGSGKIHAKWSPGHVTYRYRPTVEVNGKIDAEYAKSFPLDIFDIKESSATVNKEKLVMCHACNPSYSDKHIVFGEDKNEIVMIIEPFGQLTIQEMVDAALGIIQKNAEEVKDLLKK